jgi:hypothetical protein
MVIDGMVEVGIAPSLLLVVPRAGLSSEHPMASFVRDASKLLDVNVDEFTGS